MDRYGRGQSSVRTGRGQKHNYFADRSCFLFVVCRLCSVRTRQRENEFKTIFSVDRLFLKNYFLFFFLIVERPSTVFRSDGTGPKDLFCRPALLLVCRLSFFVCRLSSVRTRQRGNGRKTKLFFLLIDCF